MPAAFPNISRIQYEGPRSKNSLAFKHYNPAEFVEGKSMKDHLRFSVVYWHTMRGHVWLGHSTQAMGTRRRQY
jgi:xylose isomerase